ncbi:MAG: permease-like cell division protein FtsX [Kofleriaceae bacterium]
MIPRLASALRRTGRIAVDRPRAALWTLLALACALFAAGVAVIAATSIDRWAAARPGAPTSMVVYLGEGVSEARAQALVGELRALSGVERAELVPPAESARRLVRALGSDGALLEGVDLAALPASVEVALAPGVRDVIAISPTLRALRGAPGVADVVIDEAGEHAGEHSDVQGAHGDRVSRSLGAMRGLAWTGAALFAGLALIALAAIRVRLDRGRQELAVAQLLGAGPGFLVIPTALAGALSGALAALIATLALGAGLHLYRDALAGVVVPGFAELAVFVGIGALLGLIGGGLAGASRVAR